MATINFRNLSTKLTNYLKGNTALTNSFNQAFYKYIGSGFTAYDTSGKSYVENGYNVNPIVYSVISQMATKTGSVPFTVMKVKDEEAKKQLKNYVGWNFEKNPAVYLKKLKLANKAFEEIEMPMPLIKPNPYQNWSELFALSKVFLRTTGNIYFYMVSPEDGMNKGVPSQLYVLPSHLMNIVIKEKANLLLDEDPVKEYTLIEGNMMAVFPAESVIHVKLPNPNFGESGEHLYGQSPLRAGLKNIQSSNEGLNQNIKMMKNSGAYGFISGKTPLTPQQADQIKQRLIEMENDSSVLSNYAGVSVEVAFTRLSLTTEELKPFEYLNYDQKQICNVLGWSDKLLNNDAGAKYDNVSQFRKQVITDNIIPDLDLISWGLAEFLERFKEYKSTDLVFKTQELPEMQQDTEKMAGWMKDLLDRGVISRNEMRTALQFPESESEEMEVHTVSMNVIPIEMALAPSMEMPDSEEEEEEEEDAKKKIKAGFDPNQPRDDDGEWGSGGGSSLDNSKVTNSSGDPLEVYHGTDHEFDDFDDELGGTNTGMGAPKGSIYFTANLETAQSYGENIKKAYLNIENPLTVDAGGGTWDYFTVDGEDMSINKVVQRAIDNGNDGAIIKNVRDGGQYSNSRADKMPKQTTYVVFNSDQIRKNAKGEEYGK